MKQLNHKKKHMALRAHYVLYAHYVHYALYAHYARNALFALIAATCLCTGCATSGDSSDTGSTNAALSVDNGYAPEGFVRIPAGSFLMGSTGGSGTESPVHTVTLTRALYMGSAEVTQGEYQAVMQTLPALIAKNTPDADGDMPVYGLSWYEAIVYCNKRSASEALAPCYSLAGSTDSDEWPADYAEWTDIRCNFDATGYRLPTEAEWEYAARAGNAATASCIWSGTQQQSALSKYAWYYENSADSALTDTHHAHPVRTKAPNAWSVYDMSGNVQEFCWDRYNGNQYTSDRKGVTDPQGASTGTLRVVRGGCYANYLCSFCSVSSRWYQAPSEKCAQTGFRVVRAEDVSDRNSTAGQGE
ncbi:MAG: formylglycine-generating enzyme family protein [Treponema sp.]|nr:formylglycine-generating enzyme family protein [Treponema sp.]